MPKDSRLKRTHKVEKYDTLSLEGSILEHFYQAFIEEVSLAIKLFEITGREKETNPYSITVTLIINLIARVLFSYHNTTELDFKKMKESLDMISEDALILIKKFIEANIGKVKH